MKKLIALVSPILLSLTISHTATLHTYTKGLFLGSIQFPKTLDAIPSIRIYYGGNKIKCETQDTAKQITFSIPEDKRRTRFSLIVTEKIQFKATENTIEYLKINPGQPYKFYTFELVPVTSENSKQTTYTWAIQEQKNVLENGKIPDDAIIMCYKPSYIQALTSGESLEGNNAIELPKIVIKKDIIRLAGSEAKLHDASNSLLLLAVDYDTFHASIQEKTKHDNHCTRVTMVT